MKRDIQGREDIEQLIKTFYTKLLEDRLLSPIFLEVAQIQLSDHLPLLYDFWESLLFQAGKYQGNAMKVHLDLHQKQRLKSIHFDRWLALFNTTTDELFEGDKAEMAKTRALSIAQIIKMKIDYFEKSRLELGN
ncbi:MAG: group III truncated hemoglobin [Bacteroidota bacterium]